MRRTTSLAHSGGSSTRAVQRADQGATFVELLISIVLIGTAVLATLVALQTLTTASAIDANHARAFAWLQAASDEVFKADRIPCAQYSSGDPDLPSSYASRKGSSSDPPSSDPATATAWAMYKNAVSLAAPPQGWASATIRVTNIEYLGRSSPTATSFEWGAGYCFEGVQPDANGDGDPEDYRETPLLSQKITIEVIAPNGNLTKTVETVKSDR